MSASAVTDTLEVDGVEYAIERKQRHDGTQYLTVPGLPGLIGRLGYEQEDSSPFDPREDDNVGTMLVNYSGHNLGDGENDDEDGAFYIDCPSCEGTGEQKIPEHVIALRRIIDPTGEGAAVDCDRCEGEGRIVTDPATYYRKVRGARVVLPLFVYEHSGMTIRAGAAIESAATRDDVRSNGRFVGDAAGWDTSFVGFIFDTPEMVKACIGEDATDAGIEEILRGEVKQYAAYLEGDITWWSVDDSESNYEDSCGGYVGDHDYCEQSCLESMVEAIKQRHTEMTERAHWAARDTTTELES
jgi:hypothetical protein